jgi:hypothetical protein
MNRFAGVPVNMGMPVLIVVPTGQILIVCAASEHGLESAAARGTVMIMRIRAVNVIAAIFCLLILFTGNGVFASLFKRRRNNPL